VLLNICTTDRQLPIAVIIAIGNRLGSIEIKFNPLKPKSIYKLIFVMVKCSVFFKVQTEFLNII
jgi:hypothetical protein